MCLWSGGWLTNRSELGTAGPGTSDGELAAALVDRHGEDAVARLRGSLAAVLWQPARRRLLAFCDRMGERPLFYAPLSGGPPPEVLLSPALDGLLAALPRRPAADPASVRCHLEGAAPPRGRTFWDGVREVPPAGLLVLDERVLRLCSYWEVAARPTLRLASDEEYADVFRGVLEQAVRDALPESAVGVTLSAGLDSTAVACALRDVGGRRRIIAVRWIAPELPEADEDATSGAVARELGLEDLPIRADRHWPLRGASPPLTRRSSPLRLPFQEAWEETFRRAAEAGIAVLYTGSAGDHLFGGNAFSYPDLLLAGRWLRLVGELREHLPQSSLGLTGILRRMLFGPLVRSWLPRAAATVPWLGEALREVPAPEAPRVSRRLPPGRRARLRLLADPLLPQTTQLLARQAAPYGIDLRHPYRDDRVVELAAALPITQTFRAARRKIVVRNAYGRRLPPAVTAGWDKIYPAAIAHRGLRERETERVWALLDRMVAAGRGWVDAPVLREEYRRYLAGETESTFFWYALTLEAWAREHLA